MRWDKNKIKIFLLLGCLALVLPVIGQNRANPIALKTMEGGVSVVGDEQGPFYEGETIQGNAPLMIEFDGQVEAEEDVTYHCLWQFTGVEEFPRSSEETFYEFRISGIYNVSFAVTFYNAEGEIVDEYATESDFVIHITESFLKVPNAFSPNGDGINDVFKVSHQSLIKFNAYVFNRWGQELYRWGLGNIDEGWDGTYKGKTVKDGVYFIVIEAEGSDGVKYKHKGDINVLTGLGDGNYSSGSE